MGWIDIKNNLDSLPRAQRKIAEYMLDHQNESIFMTANQLGAHSKSSEASAIRLANTLGYSSFPSFMQSLQNEAKNQLSTLNRLQTHKLQPHQQTTGLVSQIINQELEQIRLTSLPHNDDAIKKLASMICEASAVYIIGLRSTRCLAIYMEFYLSWFFPKIFLPRSDTLGNFLVAAPKNSLVIGISYPRYTRQTIECLAFARHLHFQTAALTDSLSSPLAKEANISIVFPCAHIAHIDSLMLPMCLVNALLIQVADQLGTAALSRLTELEKIWTINSIYNN